MLKMEQAVHVFGQGVYEKYLYLPLHFTVKLNCSKKILKKVWEPEKEYDIHKTEQYKYLNYFLEHPCNVWFDVWSLQIVCMGG